MVNCSLKIGVVVTAWLVLAACSPITFTIGGSVGDQGLKYTVVESDGYAGSQRVAMIDVSGMLVNFRKRQLFDPGENPVSVLHEKLAAARRDKKVKAVILRLNTPGGTVTASDAMYRQVRRFKQQTGKPVIALMMDVAASGGYYLACAADHMIAYPSSVTGSIGVILQTVSLKPALDRIGIQTEAITSGHNKDAGSLLSVLTPDRRAILQNMVDDFYERFANIVRKSRPQIPDDRFQQAVDGRVLSGNAALAMGMIDQTGDLDDAFLMAKQMAGLEDADLILYHRPIAYVGSPYASSPSMPTGGTQINIAQFNFPELPTGTSVGFYYLWQSLSP